MSYCPAGATDLRSTDLREAVEAICSSSLVVGGSSGPMHLATLCCGERGHGCPQLVWCGGGAPERKTTSKRYARDWNPFKTPTDAFQCGSWQPSLESVWDRLRAFCERLEKAT